MAGRQAWRVSSLAIDNYLRNRNKRIKKVDPPLDDVEHAFHALNGRGKSSMCLTGIDNSVLSVGGGAGRYHVQVSFADSVYILCDAANSDDPVEMIIGSIETPLPGRYITGAMKALTAIRHFYRHGKLARSLQWLES